MIDLTPHDRGTVLAVRAQPNARQSGILGERAGSLRVGVTVPPEKGKANLAITRFLAEILGCRASEVILLAGEASRDKRFLILGRGPEALRERILPFLADP